LEGHQCRGSSELLWYREETIVNISSATVFIDSPGAAAYGSSKAFVLHRTGTLKLRVEEQKVKVQAGLAGYTRTPMPKCANHIPGYMMMEVDTLVDNALADTGRNAHRQ
jgi:short-subunit dehydrogenase